MPGSAVQSGSPAGAGSTRLTFSAAACSSSTAWAGSAPVRSIAFTSRCAASHGASSAVTPVSRLTTPPGTSEVASTSDSVTAGSGRASDATTTHELPVATTGASTLTSPSSADSCGASTATTPVGSGTEKSKYGPATGFAVPRTAVTLSAQPAYQTQRSIAASTSDSAPVAPESASSAANCARRPSISSATRYSTCPRLYAVAPDQPPNALRAATTASRASLREPCAALARKPPLLSRTG